MTPEQISGITALGPVCLLSSLCVGQCRGLRGPRCTAPGEHPILSRYWLGKSRNAEVIAARSVSQ